MNSTQSNRTTQLNRVEIIGIIGSVNIFNSSEQRFARITVATNFAYKDPQDKSCVIETTWHDVRAAEREGISFEGLEKGSAVHVVGRIKNERYVSQNGFETVRQTIVASCLEKANCGGEGNPMMEESSI